MLKVADPNRFESQRSQRSIRHDIVLPMLLFGSIGAIAWAVRGTSGWGGIDGTIVPGLTWGLLWYYLCQRKGIDARGLPFWLGMGLALGGELGYGQYVSWIRGTFYVRDDAIPVSPWIGWEWFAICGAAWGAPGGIVLGWTLSSSVSRTAWAVRIALASILFILLFNLGESLFGAGAIDGLGNWFVQNRASLIFPNADLGIYGGELDKHLGRTVYTNTQNFAVLLWWLLAMSLAAIQRDRATLGMGALIGGGFGIGFPLSALWCLGYKYAPGDTDWWKMWEMNAGFNLGVLYAIALYLTVRRLDTKYATPPPPETPAVKVDKASTPFIAFAAFALVFVAGYEYFFWTGLMLSLLIAGSIVLAGWSRGAASASEAVERKRHAMVACAAFLLVFMLFHGVSLRGGVLLGLYDEEAVSQYNWPAPRIALFVPFAALIVCAFLHRIWAILNSPQGGTVWEKTASHTPVRMFDLLTLIGAVGIFSIWPESVGTLYAVFLALAVFALARLNRYYDTVDSTGR